MNRCSGGAGMNHGEAAEELNGVKDHAGSDEMTGEARHEPAMW